MRHVPPLQAVRAFEAAARHENFTAAANELGMTQAAVSYQIKLLEERLGVPLFTRAKGRVALTDAGRKAAPIVSQAFDSLEDAFSSIVDEDESVLTINTTSTFASNWMAPRLGLFQIARPGLAVRLQTDNHLIDFASGDADVAIRSGRGAWPGLRRHFLFHLHSTPMCSPDFRDRHGIDRPERLFDVTRLNPQDAWWRLWFKAIGLEVEEEQTLGGIRVDSQVAEGNAAMAGHGVAMLNPCLWRPELASGRLVQLFDMVVVEQSSYWLVYPEHKRHQAKIRAFREWLAGEVAELAKFSIPEAFVPPPE